MLPGALRRGACMNSKFSYRSFPGLKSCLTILGGSPSVETLRATVQRRMQCVWSANVGKKELDSGGQVS